jgi:WD40 repeat protein
MKTSNNNFKVGLSHDKVNYLLLKLKICFSPCEEYIAAGSNGDIFIFKSSDGELVQKLSTNTKDSISCVCWSPDGEKITNTSQSKDVFTWT